MFSIVLVCLGVFQEYIMTNIAQLIRLGHTKIYVLTNADLMSHFEPFSDVIHLVSVESLDDSFGFQQRSIQDKEYRGGFWHHTSARFFVLYEFMAQTGINNVIHIENDGECQFLFVGAEGTDEVTQPFGQHGDGTVYQINGSSAFFSFFVDNASFFYIMSNIGNVYAYFP